MKKLILILCLLVITGCGKIEYSGIKQEQAEVITMNYIPEFSDCDLAPGMTTNGDLTFSLHSTYQAEKWIVVMRCSEHNKTFAIQNKELFNKVKVGSILTLNYYDEIYTDDKGNSSVTRQHTKSIEVGNETVQR